VTELHIAAAKRGNKEAFLSLVEPLEQRLFQTALGILGARTDAEDAWQNTVLKAWRHIASVRTPHFKTWLTRILINEAKQLLRTRRCYPTLSQQVNDAASDDGDISEKIMVHQLLQSLPREQREAVVLRYWLDFTLEEIANVMQVPLSTAKTRLYQGVASLKNQMKEAGNSD